MLSLQRLVCACFLLLLSARPAAAQGTKADYDRAAALQHRTQGKVFRDRIEPHWFDSNRQFWYRVGTGPGTHEFVRVRTDPPLRQAAFDHVRLAAALKQQKACDAAADRLPIDQLEFDTAGKYVDLRIGDRWWRCNLADYAVSARTGTPPPKAQTSGLRPVEGGPKASLRTGGETSIRFVNRTAGAVELFWLDPDGRRQSYGRIRPGDEHEQHTFAGHVWLVVDAKGRPLGQRVAAEKPLSVEIREPEKDRKPGPMPRTETQTAQGGQSHFRWDENQDSPQPDEDWDSPRDENWDSPYVSENQDNPQTGSRRRRFSQRQWPQSKSPDGRWEAFIKDNNVWARGADGQEFALSTDGTAEDGYGPRIFWSPDSSKLVAIRTKQCTARKVYFIESSPRDQVQPKLHSHDYVKPGDPLPIDRPRLFDVAARRHVPIDPKLFDNPWSIEDCRWSADSKRFTFVYNQRGHQALRVLAVDARSGAVRPIIDEQSKTFIDYSGKYFCQYLDASGEILWMSERDGWNHLYLYDAKTGQVKNQVTKGSWVLRSVERVDESKRQIHFRACGVYPGQDPYYIHFGRVNFDGSGLTFLTEGDGTHTIDASPDGRFLLDSWSRVDLPPVTELRRADDGRRLCELERADWSRLLATGWKPPERFVAKGRDGTTDIYGVIWRPTNFDPAKKYPVIENIYAGPQDSFVPKRFQSYYRTQSLAELGFIVVQCDGMGTSNRGKKFHDVCWKNLADAGLPDRILWIRAAAARYPRMDLGRVGIYGGSAGGQNAAGAAMTHGDFYKVAVADCGCHDNRMDKIWWNEQWMGWPVGPHYAANSNVTLAPGLKGKLLLIVGEMDTNVDPASTMQVVNALIRADKDFELLVIPGSNHGAAESPYGSRRRADFFVRHLLGVEPRR